MRDIGKLLGVDKGDFIAITGSGGKTSIMHELAESLSVRSNVWLTSSVKVSASFEKENSALVRCIGPDSIPLIPPDRISFLYSVETDGGMKLKGPCLDIISRNMFRDGANTVIMEADGSKRKPLKYYAPYDRPLTGMENVFIVVVGMSCFGEKISSENVHRLKLPSDNHMCGKIDEKFILSVLYSDNGYFDIPFKGKRRLVFTGIDTAEKYGASLNIAKIHKNLYDDFLCFFRGPLFGQTGKWWDTIK